MLLEADNSDVLAIYFFMIMIFLRFGAALIIVLVASLRSPIIEHPPTSVVVVWISRIYL